MSEKPEIEKDATAQISGDTNCQADVEARHAKELLLLEEEARIRRSNLMKRINYEHCVQKKQREELLKKLRSDLYRIRRELKANIQCLELEVEELEGTFQGISLNRAAKEGHLKMCHQATLERLSTFRNNVHLKTEALAAQKPEIEDEIEELEKPANTQSVITLEELGKKLRELRSAAIKAQSENRLKETEIRESFLTIAGTKELLPLEAKLKNDTERANMKRGKEESSLNDIEVANSFLRKKVELIQNEELEEMEARLLEEMAAMEKQIEEEEKVEQELINSGIRLREHFEELFEAKLEQRSTKNADIIGRLQERLDLVNGKIETFEGLLESLPLDLNKLMAEKKEEHANRIKKLDERGSKGDIEHDSQMAELREMQGDAPLLLQREIDALEREEKTKIEKFEALKEKLEKQIEEATALLPELMEEIKQSDQQFVDSLAQRHGTFGKTQVMNQLVATRNANTLEQLKNELEQLDKRIKHADKEAAIEIEARTEEAEALLAEHRKRKVDKEATDSHMRKATEEIRSEMRQAKYKLRCMKAMIRETNLVLAGIDVASLRTERDLKTIMERCDKGHMEEKERLENLMEDLAEEHDNSKANLEDAIEGAAQRKADMLEKHEEQREAFKVKQIGAKEMFDLKDELQGALKALGFQVEDLDKKIEGMVSQHEKEIENINKAHEQHLKELKSQRAMQLHKVDEQQELNYKTEKLQEALRAVNLGLEAIGADVIAADKDEVKALMKERDDLNSHNKALADKLGRLNQAKDNISYSIQQISAVENASENNTEAEDKSDLRYLQNIHVGLRAEIAILKKELQKYQ